LFLITVAAIIVYLQEGCPEFVIRFISLGKRFKFRTDINVILSEPAWII